MRAICLAVIALCLASSAGHAQRPSVDAAVEARVNALLARMTLAEKIGQLNLIARDERTSLQMEAVKSSRSGAIMNVVKRAWNPSPNQGEFVFPARFMTSCRGSLSKSMTIWDHSN